MTLNQAHEAVRVAQTCADEMCIEAEKVYKRIHKNYDPELIEAARRQLVLQSFDDEENRDKLDKQWQRFNIALCEVDVQRHKLAEQHLKETENLLAANPVFCEGMITEELSTKVQERVNMSTKLRTLMNKVQHAGNNLISEGTQFLAKRSSSRSRKAAQEVPDSSLRYAMNTIVVQIDEEELD